MRTYGCQMNEYDSELIRSILIQEGYSFVESAEDAEIILLNTCSVRENAHRKVIGHIHALQHSLKERPFLLGILGCMAVNLKDDLLNDPSLNINFVIGPDGYRRLPDIISRTSSRHNKAEDTCLSGLETYTGISPSRISQVNAWVAVMRGCNNFCTFCIVPYTRGRERSRPKQDILQEIQNLVARGYKQVTLLGQNVNSYQDSRTDFADLLEAVSEVPGLERIRFMSPHPKDFLDRVIDVVAHNPKVCEHLHLPLQAGNSRVLQLMNRTYDQEQFLKLVDKIRNACPDVALTTDVIVGFPTETAEEFEDTVKVMRQVEFDAAFIFKYSPRKGTIAQKKYPDDVPEEEKTRRIVHLNELQKDISLRKNQQLVGTVQDVLIEDLHSQRSQNDIQGRTRGNKLVIVSDSRSLMGETLRVKISDASPHVLKGQLEASQ